MKIAMKSKKDSRLISWAKHHDGTWCHADDAEKGVNYQCIACSRPIIFRHYDDRIDHFSHIADCNCSGESVIHSMAKEIIASASRVTLPGASSEGTIHHHGDSKYYQCEIVELMSPFTVVSGSTEEKLAPNWICDAFCMGKSEISVAFEVRYSNKKDDNDQAKFRQHDIAVVEVDVRGFDASWPLEQVSHWILSEAPRIWLHCPMLEQAKQRAREEALTKLLERHYANPKKGKYRKSRMQVQRDINRSENLPRFESAMISYERGERMHIRVAPVYAKRTSGLSHLVDLPKFQPELVTVKKRDINAQFGWSGRIFIESARNGGVTDYPFYYVEKRSGFEKLELPDEPYAIVFDDESKRNKQHTVRFQNIEHWVEKLIKLYSR